MPFRTKAEKAAYDKARYHRKREELLAQKRAYYYANREELIAKVQARTDPEEKRRYDREYNQRHEVRTRRAAQRKGWEQANPEKAKAHNRERSLIRRNARPDATALEYMAILEGDPCSYCGGPYDHIDHIDPLARGGTSQWDNLTASCAACNYAKRDRPLLAALTY